MEGATGGQGHHAASRRMLAIRIAPALAALVGIGVIYAVISEQFWVGPRGALFWATLALAGMLAAAVRAGRRMLSRSLAFAALALVTGAEVASTAVLIRGLLGAADSLSGTPHAIALTLLRDATLLWIVNILTFSLWYWEVDAGGPGVRHYHGYASRDLLFPQMALAPEQREGWAPHYVDYLFMSFTTSTAFSPTDTPVLSVRVKLLVMAQSLISLAVLAVIAARAINTL